METLWLSLIGVGALILGGRLLMLMLMPARRPDGMRSAIGGLILMLIGLIALVGGVWSAGALVGDGG